MFTQTELQHPDRNLALELVRATEAAAIRATPWVGRGDKNSADGAAVDAMRAFLSTVSMDGVVVIGEGEKDHAPMLYNGEHVGNGTGSACDVAVDPIDGTSLTAEGNPNAVSVLAVVSREVGDVRRVAGELGRSSGWDVKRLRIAFRQGGPRDPP